MHPAFREAALRDNRLSLDRKLRQSYLRRKNDPAPRFPLETVTLRLAREHDDETLERLAELNGLARVDGPHVVAEVEGAVTAALPLGAGPALGDPFRPNAHLMSLLELLRQQLAVRDRGSTSVPLAPAFRQTRGPGCSDVYLRDSTTLYVPVQAVCRA